MRAVWHFNTFPPLGSNNIDAGFNSPTGNPRGQESWRTGYCICPRGVHVSGQAVLGNQKA